VLDFGGFVSLLSEEESLRKMLPGNVREYLLLHAEAMRCNAEHLDNAPGANVSGKSLYVSARRLFDEADTNQNGVLDGAEITNLLTAFAERHGGERLADNDMRSMHWAMVTRNAGETLRMFDADGDGHLSFHEFLAMLATEPYCNMLPYASLQGLREIAAYYTPEKSKGQVVLEAATKLFNRSTGKAQQLSTESLVALLHQLVAPHILTLWKQEHDIYQVAVLAVQENGSVGYLNKAGFYRTLSKKPFKTLLPPYACDSFTMAAVRGSEDDVLAIDDEATLEKPVPIRGSSLIGRGSSSKDTDSSLQSVSSLKVETASEAGVADVDLALKDQIASMERVQRCWELQDYCDYHLDGYQVLASSEGTEEGLAYAAAWVEATEAAGEAGMDWETWKSFFMSLQVTCGVDAVDALCDVLETCLLELMGGDDVQGAGSHDSWVMIDRVGTTMIETEYVPTPQGTPALEGKQGNDLSKLTIDTSLAVLEKPEAMMKKAYASSVIGYSSLPMGSPLSKMDELYSPSPRGKPSPGPSPNKPSWALPN